MAADEIPVLPGQLDVLEELAVPRPTSFAETIRRIETERLTEAKAAIDAGWKPDDHPERCCPTETPVSKAIRSPEERRRWFLHRAGTAEDNARRTQRTVDRLEAELEPTRRADHGEINIPMAKRSKSLDSDITKAAQLVKARQAINNYETRARHWRAKAATIAD